MWIKKTNITANDYNPNNVAPPEKRLLSKSLELDGFTQPIVVTENAPQHYEIVDGFHRHDIGSNRAILKRQLKGYLLLPACVKRAGKSSIAWRQLFVTTARGRHQINAMSEIVRELVLMGWSEQKIGQLGMDSDEVLRLK